MTLSLVTCSDKFIVVSIDSAETNEYADGHYEYKSVKKYQIIQNIGFISTWGNRVGNNIFNHLNVNKNEISNIDKLAELTLYYLDDIYGADKPADIDSSVPSSDIGYHIAGFDKNGKPHVYHIFWGIPQPNIKNKPQIYDLCEHEANNEIFLQILFNGRNDVACRVILDNIKYYGIKTIDSIVKIHENTLEQVSQQTKQVSGPFHHFIISQDNNIEKIDQKSFKNFDQIRDYSSIHIDPRLLAGETFVLPSGMLVSGMSIIPPSSEDDGIPTSVITISPYIKD